MNDTLLKYKEIIVSCKEIFKQKNIDYGTSWRILRLPAITDQIFIKVQRIRVIEEKRKQKVSDNIREEFQGVINYCIIAMIQLDMPENEQIELEYHKVEKLYDNYANETFELLNNKNHDYEEAWKDMRLSSIIDIILVKIHRIKQIEDNQGKTIISEGVKANYQDIINYAVFSLIKLEKQ